jgi:hypothetical protein
MYRFVENNALTESKMKTATRTIALIVIICFISINNIFALEKSSVNFIGLNPSVTVEPFYEKGELDVNIFPLVYQTPISKRIDFRVSSIVNYGVRNSNSTFSHLGFQAALPIFLKKKDIKLIPSKGLFVAPGFGVTRNLIEKHSNFGLWVEPGYNLLFDDNFAISFSAQFGATHF